MNLLAALLSINIHVIIAKIAFDIIDVYSLIVADIYSYLQGKEEEKDEIILLNSIYE